MFSTIFQFMLSECSNYIVRSCIRNGRKWREKIGARYLISCIHSRSAHKFILCKCCNIFQVCTPMLSTLIVLISIIKMLGDWYDPASIYYILRNDVRPHAYWNMEQKLLRRLVDLLSSGEKRREWYHLAHIWFDR